MIQRKMEYSEEHRRKICNLRERLDETWNELQKFDRILAEADETLQLLEESEDIPYEVILNPDHWKRQKERAQKEIKKLEALLEEYVQKCDEMIGCWGPLSTCEGCGKKKWRKE